MLRRLCTLPFVIVGLALAAPACDDTASGADADATTADDADTGPTGPCADESFPVANPGGGAGTWTESGTLCPGQTDRVTYNVSTSCTTSVKVTLADAYDTDGSLVRDASVSLTWAGNTALPAAETRDRVGDDLVISLVPDGDSFGAVTVRMTRVDGEVIPWTLEMTSVCTAQ